METILLDGFRYEFEVMKMWRENTRPFDVMQLSLIDDAHGIRVEVMFSMEAWDEFAKTIKTGTLINSPDFLARVGR